LAREQRVFRLTLSQKLRRSSEGFGDRDAGLARWQDTHACAEKMDQTLELRFVDRMRRIVEGNQR
jgi:hypothetical protein